MGRSHIARVRARRRALSRLAVRFYGARVYIHKVCLWLDSCSSGEVAVGHESTTPALKKATKVFVRYRARSCAAAQAFAKGGEPKRVLTRFFFSIRVTAS